ncbi:hypothetical protein GCM10010317_095360 [Streptomyces mirabilis]|nr:hypothetical protein GCM10010317_095360 [Streptomyces mirabilis]
MTFSVGMQFSWADKTAKNRSRRLIGSRLRPSGDRSLSLVLPSVKFDSGAKVKRGRQRDGADR